MFGKDHLSTLVVKESLGMLYFECGNTGKARQLLEAVLESMRIIFGEDHPDTINAIVDLVSVYRELGRKGNRSILKSAAELLEQVSENATRVFGSDDPFVLAILENTAGVATEQGKTKLAKEMEGKAADLRRKISARKEGGKTQDK